MGVIFVAGVHAVGKTTLCKRAEQELGIAHYSASGLIRAEKASVIPEREKAVNNVNDAQRLLIQGVARVKSLHAGRILLDGHFTLLTSDGCIEPVEVEVFRALDVDRAILIHDTPEAIAQRWQARDGLANSLDTIKTHQEAEFKNARHVAQTMAIPLVVIKAFDFTAFLGNLD
jgi:adenylate kinase